MPVKVYDRGMSPRISADPKNPTVEADFWAEGLDDTPDVLDTLMVEVMKFAPVQVTFRLPNYSGPLGSTFFTRLYQAGVKDQKIEGPGKGTATVVWAQSNAAPSPSKGGPDPNNGGNGPEADEVLGPEWRFGTDGGTRHITQSIQTIKGVIDDGTGEGAALPDFKRVIGLSRDRVEGCDIGVGDLTWSYTIKGAEFNTNYWRLLTALSYTTNSTKYMGREAGEILFKFADAHFTPGAGWEVTFNFAERPNEQIGLLPQLSQNSPHNGATKGGHDYIWYVYQDGTVGTDPYKFTIQKPVAAVLERVYRKDSEIIFKNLAGVEVHPLLKDLIGSA